MRLMPDVSWGFPSYEDGFGCHYTKDSNTNGGPDHTYVWTTSHPFGAPRSKWFVSVFIPVVHCSAELFSIYDLFFVETDWNCWQLKKAVNRIETLTLILHGHTQKFLKSWEIPKSPWFLFNAIMGVSWNRGTPKSSILNGIFMDFPV